MPPPGVKTLPYYVISPRPSYFLGTPPSLSLPPPPPILCVCVCLCVVGWLHPANVNIRLWQRQYMAPPWAVFVVWGRGQVSLLCIGTKHASIIHFFTKLKDVQDSSVVLEEFAFHRFSCFVLVSRFPMCVCVCVRARAHTHACACVCAHVRAGKGTSGGFRYISYDELPRLVVFELQQNYRCAVVGRLW